MARRGWNETPEEQVFIIRDVEKAAILHYFGITDRRLEETKLVLGE